MLHLRSDSSGMFLHVLWRGWVSHEGASLTTPEEPSQVSNLRPDQMQEKADCAALFANPTMGASTDGNGKSSKTSVYSQCNARFFTKNKRYEHTTGSKRPVILFMTGCINHQSLMCHSIIEVQLADHVTGQ